LEGIALELPHDLLLRLSTKSIAVSEYSRQQLLKRRIDAEKIYNGVKPPKLEIPTTRNDEGRRFLFVGRIGPRKGKYLPKIWGEIQELDSKAKLDIIGHPASDKLSTKLRETDGVEFHGSVDSISPYYKRSDALLFPSRAEACPLTVLEAQSFGCPVVAFDLCSHDELIDDGSTGSVVPAYDTTAFANKAICWASENRSDVVPTCRQWISENYSNNSMIQQYIRVYENILNSY
jgi:glycosyltransferase involved in cell wall biosynthesis